MKEKGTRRLREFLKSELESGAYVMHHEAVFRAATEALTSAERDPELEAPALEAMAGLAVRYPEGSRYWEGFVSSVKDASVSSASKTKAMQVVRSGLLDPDQASSALRLYRFFLDHSEARLSDLAARTFLQTLTEMRVGGQMERVLRDSFRTELREILAALGTAGWLEAGELAGFLELAEG